MEREGKISFKIVGSLMNMHTDERLMEIFRGNKGGQGAMAFDLLYRRYAKPMVNYFYYALGNDYEKAQDFLHDLFLKIIENKEKFDSRQLFKPWIYRIALNMCKNEYRSKTIIRKYQDHIKSTGAMIVDCEKKEGGLRFCINSLEQDQRSLIILRFKFSLSIKEIATIFDCAEGTVKSRLFYATKELSEIYKK